MNETSGGNSLNHGYIIFSLGEGAVSVKIVVSTKIAVPVKSPSLS